MTNQGHMQEVDKCGNEAQNRKLNATWCYGSFYLRLSIAPVAVDRVFFPEGCDSHFFRAGVSDVFGIQTFIRSSQGSL